MRSIKRIGSRLTICAVAILAFDTSNSHAQLDDIGTLIRAGSADATALTRAYLRPLATGLSTGLNSGWNTSAAPRKLLGFSLEIRAAAAFVPDNRQSFDINSLTLTRLALQPGESSTAATIAGSDDDGPVFDIFDGPAGARTDVGDLQLPPGTGYSIVPAPMIQAGLGLIKSTDVTVRYIPETSIGDYGDIALVGAAVKTEITDWFPAGKLLPIDISLQVGFTNVDLSADLDAPGSDDQKVTTTSSSYVVNALVGKRLPIISLYAGLGIQGGTFDVDVTGDYDIPTSLGGMPQTTTVTDPISFSIDSDVKTHLLGGFRLKLGFLSIFAEGTVAEYSTVNAGIGFGLRN